MMTPQTLQVGYGQHIWLRRWMLVLLCIGTLWVIQGCAHAPSGAATQTPPERTQALLTAANQADQLYANGQFEQARPAFKKLTEQYPRNAYFWFRLGNCEAQLGQYPQAIEALQYAIALDPSDGRFSYNLAFAHSALARDAYAKARSQLPVGSALRREADQSWRLLEAVVGPSSSGKPPL